MWGRSNNNNNIVAIRKPALRYTAQQGDVRFSNAPFYRRTAPGYIGAARPPLGSFGAPICSGMTGRMLLCTLMGCLILAAVIGTAVGILIGIGKGSDSSNSTSNPSSTLPPSLTPSASPSTSISTSKVTGSTPSPLVSGSNPSQAGSSISPNSANPPLSVTPGPGITGSPVTTRGAEVSGASPNTGPIVTGTNPPAVTTGPKITGPVQTGSVGTRGDTVGVTSPRMGTGTVTERPVQTTGKGAATSGVQTVTTGPQTTKAPLVLCPTSPVLIYRRTDATTQFNRTWTEMRSGFGAESSNYWRGLDDISSLTQQNGGVTMRVYYESLDTSALYMAQYSNFKVGAEGTGYQLTISGISGNFTSDAFQTYNGYTFQTYDKGPSPNCASQTGGAWWYAAASCNCGACLTQAGQENFYWKAGLGTTIKIKTSWMELVCP